MKEVNNRFNQWLDRFFHLGVEDYVEASDYAPPYEILESDHSYVMCVDLPGVTAHDLSVEILNDELVIHGERALPRLASRRGSLQSGKFRRAFHLPAAVDEEGIEANYRNGVLEIALPKRRGRRQRKIAVGEGSSSFVQRYFPAEPATGPAGETLTSLDEPSIAPELELGRRGRDERAA